MVGVENTDEQEKLTKIKQNKITEMVASSGAQKIKCKVENYKDIDRNATTKENAQPTQTLSLKRQRTSEVLLANQDFYVPAIDEFGGYSSRLRIPELMNNGTQETKNAKKAARKSAPVSSASPMPDLEDGQGASLSLCHLLNIDVEKLAQQIVDEDLAALEQKA